MGVGFPGERSSFIHDGDSPQFAKHQGPLALERLEGDTWVELGRYDTTARASSALDDLAAEGVHSSHLRLTPVAPAKAHRFRRSRAK